MLVSLGFTDLLMAYVVISITRDFWLLLNYVFKKDVKDVSLTKSPTVSSKQKILPSGLDEVFMLPGPRHKASQFLNKPIPKNT